MEEFKWNELPQVKDAPIKEGDIRYITLTVRAAFSWSDKIVSDVDDENKPIEYKSGWVMDVFPEKMIYKGEVSEFVANSFKEDKELAWYEKNQIIDIDPEAIGWNFKNQLQHVLIYDGMKNSRNQPVSLMRVTSSNWIAIYNSTNQNSFAGRITKQEDLKKVMELCEITKIETNEKD